MDIASASVDRVFDYRVPSAMKEPGWRVRVPFGPRQIEGYVIALSETTELAEDKVRDIAAVLDSAPALLPEMIELARWMKGQYHCRLVDALRLMIPAQMRGGRVREKTVRMARLSVPKEAALAEAERLSRRAPVQAAILRTLAEGEKALTALAEMYTSANSAARSLSSKGLLIFEDKAIRRMPYQSLMGDGGEALALLPGQRAAADRIAEALRGTPGKPFLIRGITGSGKTEVYFESIAETLELGRSAIVLVPEISLTPQMVQRFTRRFGPLCAVLHSRLSVGERYDEWQRIRAGEARVVIGARSAVFAPAERLGLIVVDEEHELSYRSETQVRYDAVEVAEKRCAMAGAVLVMGSATPSIARFHEAESGKYRLITLESRAMGELPEVTVVDMCQESPRGQPVHFQPHPLPAAQGLPGPEGAGHPLFEPAGLFHLRLLPGVRACDAVRALRRIPHLSHVRTEAEMPLLRLRDGTAQDMPGMWKPLHPSFWQRYAKSRGGGS